MEILQRWVWRVTDVTQVLSILSVAFMMMHITLDVAAKYFLGSPLPGTIVAVANYYMLVVAFLPLGLAERRDAHISVEVFTELLNDKIQFHLRGFSYLFSATIFGCLSYRTYLDAVKRMESGAFLIEQGVRVIVWPAHFLLPIGCGLFVLVLMVKFGFYLTGCETPKLERNAAGAEEQHND